jgi:UDP-N-acetylmuramoyl-tripeptide--D-alanyl-D-alanine ligase
MLIGYLHHRKTPFALKRAYAFAAVAKAEGAEILYFSPKAICESCINGFIYTNGEWEQAVSRYPDVVYNTTGLSDENQLNTIPFTSFSIGDKMTVYQNLKKYKVFSDYLIPSEMITSARQLFSFTDRYSDIVLKPSSGHQGQNICHIKKGREMPKDALTLITEEACIAQPYINCRTKSGSPYDFRLHAQKGRNGKWMVPAIYPRISPDGGIVCNISRGGHTRNLDEFLADEFDKSYDMKKYLEVFALQLASHMDEIQTDLYNESLDELGIDVGWYKQLYIYEVNWRPGHPPFIQLDLSIIKNTVHYAMFLAENRKVNI